MSNVKLRQVSKRFRIRQERARSFHELVVEKIRPWEHDKRQDVWALRNLDLDVSHGETLGIIGPNGAGKSTILKLIARVLQPTSGQITVQGKVSSLLELGAGFHPDLSGRENVFLYGSILGFSRREMACRFDDIVDFSGIANVIDAPVKRYSSGMYLRLAFAVAIHLEPDILLVDEVFAVGDQAYQKQCLQRIRDLQSQGTTILFVSHHMQTIKQMCSRVVWIANGRLVASGRPEHIIDRYLHQDLSNDQTSLRETHLFSGVRWGSREVEITKISLLNAQGTACSGTTTGGTLHFRIDFTAHQRIAKPVFGLAIYRDDGTHVNGPNTQLAELPIESVHGPGTVEYKVDTVPLLPGVYTLSAAVYDWDGLYAYDHWHQAFPFTITPGETQEIYGMVWMPARWRFINGKVELQTK
jgi:ABC-type polysaccharide/polyol phosphate transport system ATPase subunit